MKAYDWRFCNLDLAHDRVSEVVKLYVDPVYRRSGVASCLFDRLKQSAETKGIGSLYLHTHPFLTGARDFWEKQGFVLLKEDRDSPFQTIHMESAGKARIIEQSENEIEKHRYP